MKTLHEIYIDYGNLFLIGCIFISTIIFLKLLIPFFIKVKFLDKPNNRSNHIDPVSLGGGLVIVPVVFLASFLYGYDWSLANIFTLFVLFLILFYMRAARCVMPQDAG